MNTSNNLSKITITMHWLVALSIVGMIGFGWYMVEYKVYSLYHIHKSVGLVVFALIIARVVWRMKEGWPTPAANYQKHEIALSKIVHWILLVSTILIPIWGMIGSGNGGHGFGLFGLDIIPRNVNPDDVTQVIARNEYWSEMGGKLHFFNVVVLVGALVLHITGALKHHIFDKDNTLNRMLGKSKDLNK